MKNKTFYDNKGRGVTIVIEDGGVSFYDAYFKSKMESLLEKAKEIENDVCEEDYKVHEFYWFLIDYWVKDKTERIEDERNLHKHMMEKNWFTSEMKLFIDENT